MGGHLQLTAPRSRPKRLLSLEPEALIGAVGGERTATLVERLRRFDAGRQRSLITRAGIASACRHRGDFEWPEYTSVDPEPPWVLYALGDPGLLAAVRPAVAVVGARKADSYGRETARLIGREVTGAGAVVVSGLALGIDASAHIGALDTDAGRTVAVVGGGVDRPYPRSNSTLHRRISERGCIVSEMPPGTGVWRWSFPARNRLIAAMSRLVVVVQADLGSGSLHTAEAALARGVPVAGVPGRIDSPLSSGVNHLIADGAVVIGAPGVVPGLVGLAAAERPSVPEELKEALDLVIEGRSGDLIERGDDDAARLALDLARLELQGLVERVAGGRWVLTGGAG
ncbi:MAG: DNA-processing protein DprA [Actinomycetes bacterium]